MKRLVKKISEGYAALSTKAHVKGSALLYQNIHLAALVGGVAILGFGLSGLALAQANPPGDGGGAGAGDPNTQIIYGICNVMALTEGAFGALVMTVSGLIAVVSAAMGMYRAALSLLVVALGTYLVRPIVILFFGDWDCTSGARITPT